MSFSSRRFAESGESLDVALDGVEALLESTGRAIDAKWLASLEIPLATDMAMLKISKLVAWAMMAHDGEVDVEQPALPLEYYSPDAEPSRPAIDAWARGTVPTRKPEEHGVDMMYKKEKDEKTPSVSSFRTSNSGTTAKTSNSRTSNVTRAKSSGGRRVEQEEDPTGQIVELDDPDEEFGEFAGKDLLVEHLSKMKKQKSTAAAAEDVKGEFELLQEGIDSQLKDLKTKKYAIDATGKVIPLQPVRAEALPPYVVPLETSIASPRATTGRASANAGMLDKRKKKVVRVAGSRSIDEELFRPSNTLATVLSTGEQISLQAGVNLKVGSSTRDGPSLPENPNKASRKHYLSRVAAPESRASTKGGATAELSLEDTTADGLEYHQSGFAVSSSSPMGGLPQSMQSSRFPDINILEGGRRVVGADELAALELMKNPSDAELGLGPKNTSGQVQPYVLAKKKDPDTQLYDFDTKKTGHPKDRDMPVNQRLPSERKHQLAPPPGKVSIRTIVPGGPGSPHPSSSTIK